MDKLNLMLSFISVAEEGTFTAAAARLGKTKALISTHISQLEESLQVQLIRRSTRSLQLSSTGQAYYEEAKRVLDDIASIEAKMKNEHDSLVGRLRISTPRTFGELILMPLIADLAINNDHLSIELVLNDRFVDLISEGFDAAIRIGDLDDSSLIARPVSHSQLRLCVSPGFIEEHGTPTHPDQLAGLPSVVDTNTRARSPWICHRDGQAVTINVTPVVSVNSALAAATLAANSNIIAYSPAFAVNGLIANGQLVQILSDYETPTVPINVIYPSRKHLSSKVRVFTEKVREYLEKSDKSGEVFQTT